MGHKLTVKAHLSCGEIDEYIRTSRSPIETRRWLVIRAALSSPLTSTQLSQQFGLSAGSIRNLIGQYNRLGESFLRQGRNFHDRRAYLSKSEEKKFISI